MFAETWMERKRFFVTGKTLQKKSIFPIFLQMKIGQRWANILSGNPWTNLAQSWTFGYRILMTMILTKQNLLNWKQMDKSKTMGHK